MSIVLKVEHLSHRYSSAWAIRDINFEISQHGVIGLLGSNGAGKSTTMNIICGVLNQTEGNVYINGVDKKKNPRLAKKQLGFLPQTPPLYADFTVNEYLTYTADLRFIEKTKVKQSVAEVMDRTGISHFSSRLIKNLSGGYRQRVGIAQAIIHKPGIVILDEPTNGLDPNQIIEARKLIREIAQDHTILLSSHVLSEINLLCRDIIMIESGRMVFSDSMESFNNYIQPNAVLARMENPPAENELMKIPGVTKVQFLTDKQYRIFFHGNTAISEAIIAASMQHNWRLTEISLERSVLDDVFKQLSQQA
ncbi:ABC transporter ATP-binding protein [Pseudobacter ginsenosidimutans]|jgi:ABC-2 type transport system ATP-binding protein|uniref:ABC-2 type transport system ATP-binding protein n=1 Tax=Pseudobacter ginsenosidimutans TaxID=661488 RepID=A0A4Q7N5A7_9BACT|nr:ABC transporter ATP-binding protein [Pseudobacter ginsenosidimutans]QEC44727.1 ABC transporter ATP-binding protein [Pseudobacter ginsenosidimutans]RZS76208.1 ABC-2 type transport system ATP-binding protein [Pseudobacter ginsenosidimutans]